MIDFNTIPAQLRVPGNYIEFDTGRAAPGLSPAPHSAVLVGQKLETGTAPANVAVRIVSADAAIALFGRGSMLAAMVRAFRAADPVSDLFAVPLVDDPNGVAGVQSFVVAGSAETAGVLSLMIAGQLVAVPLAVGLLSPAIAAAIAARIDALPDLPVVATVVGATVRCTARHRGEALNGVDYRSPFLIGRQPAPAGVTLVRENPVIGTIDPDIAPALAAIASLPVSTLCLGFTGGDTLAKVETELADRWGPTRMSETLAFAAAHGTQGQLAALGAARNSAFVSIMGLGSVPNPAWEWAAAYGAVVGFNASIDPARPFQTLALPGLAAPAADQAFSRVERELLLRDGISTFTVDAAGVVAIERAITTYQANALGLDDVAWLDVNTPATLAYLRLAVRTRIALKFPRHKLASDDALFGAGQAIVTPRILRAELIALFRELEEAGLVEGMDRFVDQLQVERDPSDPSRVNALIPPDLINQFRVFAARVEFRL